MTNEVLKSMTENQQDFYIKEYNRRSKSKAVAYVFWFFVGLHYAYLRRWGWQFVFWFTFGGAVVWWIVDLFRIPLMVNDYNQSVSVEVAKDAKNLA